MCVCVTTALGSEHRGQPLFVACFAPGGTLWTYYLPYLFLLVPRTFSRTFYHFLANFPGLSQPSLLLLTFSNLLELSLTFSNFLLTSSWKWISKVHIVKRATRFVSRFSSAGTPRRPSFEKTAPGKKSGEQ